MVERNTMSYTTPAHGRLWVPSDREDQIEKQRIKEDIENLENVTPLVDARDDRVAVDEMYVDDGNLELGIVYGDWLASASIPLRPSNSLQKILSDLNKSFDVTSKESGYFAANTDIELIDTVTPDSQGRVTLGREYAGRDVQLLVVER